MEHVLSELKKMKVKEVNVRSDNAGESEYFFKECIIKLVQGQFYRAFLFSGAYHGYGTIASMPAISRRTGVIVRTLSFSEAQAGKSSCDRVAAQVKRKLGDYLDSNHDVDTLEAMYDGISQAGLSGISVYLCQVSRPPGGEKKKKETITGIH